MRMHIYSYLGLHKCHHMSVIESSPAQTFLWIKIGFAFHNRWYAQRQFVALWIMPALHTLAKWNIYTQPDGICQLCWIQLPGLKCSGCLLEFVCFWEYLHLWYIIYNRTNGSFEIIICFIVLMTTNCICDLQGSSAMVQRNISTENSLIFASQLTFW